MIISARHQSVYSTYVISNSFFEVYMNMRLVMSMISDTMMKSRVYRNMTESPSPNQAVSENGIDMFRYTTAKRTENVTVPISWYLPKRYSGSFLFIFVCALVLLQ